MSKRITPQAAYLDDWTVEVRTPFDASFVHYFKQEIPAPFRFWDPSRRVWTVQAPDPRWAAFAVDLLFDFFPYAKVKGKVPSTAKSRSGLMPLAQDYAALHLLPSAPSEVVRAVYRTLALQIHPDRGGDAVAMQQLNASYERLQKAGVA